LVPASCRRRRSSCAPPGAARWAGDRTTKTRSWCERISGSSSSRTEWAATLADEIKRAQAAGVPDTGATYYGHWLNAPERLVTEKGLADAGLLARYHDAWDHAADRTPHGTPIEIRPEDFR